MTLKAKWHFMLLATTLYVIAPVENAMYYKTQEQRGAYPPNADSIAIPIAAFALGVLILSPLYAVAVWLAARSYRGGLSLLAFDRARFAPAILWSFVLGGLALYCIIDGLHSVTRRLPVDGIAALLWAYLLACLRSSLAGGNSDKTSRQ